MLRRLFYTSFLLLYMFSFLIPLSATAKTRIPNAILRSQNILDFPIPDPLYIYNQFSYVTSHFQRREAGYTTNQGHDQFAAYWSQEMAKNLAGFGPQPGAVSGPAAGAGPAPRGTAAPGLVGGV